MQKLYVKGNDLMGTFLREVPEEEPYIFQNNAIYLTDKELHDFVKELMLEGETVTVYNWVSGLKRLRYSCTVYKENTVTYYERRKRKEKGTKEEGTKYKCSTYEFK